MRLAAIALVTAALAPGAVAHAATVSMTVPPCDTLAGKYGQCDPGTLAFTAAPGEANHLTYESGSKGDTFTDTGAPLTAGSGCTQVDANTATCPVGPIGMAKRIDLGDGDDSADLLTPMAVDGGAGNDTLTGSSGVDGLVGGDGNDKLAGGGGDDLLRPGAGDDSVDGGDGTDVVTFSERTIATSIDLAAGTAGAAGESDRLTSVEGAVGGSGGDRLQGADGDDRLTGGPGSDTIDGGAGADRIKGEAGADVIRGGDGDDLIDGGPGADRVDAGAGDDGINVTTESGLADKGFDTFLTPDLGTNREPLPVRTRVVCGDGLDRVIADGDVLGKDCEAVVLTLAYSPGATRPILTSTSPRPLFKGRSVTLRLPCVTGLKQRGRCEVDLFVRTSSGKILAKRKVVLKKTSNVTLRLRRKPPKAVDFGVFAYGFGPGNSQRAETRWVAEY